MNSKPSVIMLTALSVVILAIGCATTQKHWEVARQADSIRAYEEFLNKHPKGEFAEQARQRLDELYIMQDWNIARVADSIPTYEEFLEKYPDSRLADQARSRIETMKRDLQDWERTMQINTIKGYADFLKGHPDSPFAEKAKGKIVDIEVSDILRGEHGNLPSPERISGGGVRTYSVMNIHNDTRYNLTIRYSGPESFKVIFSPKEKGSIEILRGTYKVAASVDAANVQDYAGIENSDCGNYEVVYYIITTGPFGITSPTISLPTFNYIDTPKFEPWPNKREVPNYLK